MGLRGSKKLLMILLILVLFGTVVGGMVWHMQHYVMVDFTFYPKQQETLDLRDREITVAHYEKIRRRLPDCKVAWNVPFQGGAYPEDTKEITITTLTEADIGVLDYLKQLQTIHAEDCQDYAQLLALQKRRPEVAVNYRVALGGDRYAQSVSLVDVKNLTEEEISLLPSLPKLKTVICSGGEETVIGKLQAYCRENGLEFGVRLGKEAVLDVTTSVTVEGITEEQIVLLKFLPKLEKVHMIKPMASAESVIRLQDQLPKVAISWEQEVLGVLCSTEDTELDFSQVIVTDLAQLEQGLAYFPDVEKVFLGKPGIENETLAAFREEKRSEYKVVWTVQCGNKMTARTDDLTFMPTREYVYYFNDEEAYNLRYCEDMVCIDIGHMSIHNIDFVEFMPNLEYLILAHTQVQYIEPIKHCQKLKFLELDWTPIKDLSPLVECKALEDLNLGNTFADFDPIEDMTWLKNLWMIGCSSGARYRMTQALPETKVMISGSATVANGWRNLENYYAMRDILGMEYMSW